MNILDRIVDDTLLETARRKTAVPISRLMDAPLFRRRTSSLEKALRGEDLAVIAEVKKASPSKGVIREDFDPVTIARGYEDAGAAAISILTEPQHFQGSLDHLLAVRESSTLPLLRKDFIVDLYQLYEARAAGADAVLLIAAILDGEQLHDLLEATRELEMSALVEVYEVRELDRIDFDEVSILGVNNRDLRTFEVDIDHSLRVFEHVPPDVVRVSESGLSTSADLVHLRRHGIDAVLIGETLMRRDDPGAALRRLREEVRSEFERAANYE